MRLGVVTSVWSAAGIPLRESLLRAYRHGIRAVDVFGRGHGDVRNLSRAEMKEAAAVAASTGLEVASLIALFPYNSASDDPEVRRKNWDYFLRSVDFAQMLKARRVAYICGEREFDLPMEEAWKRSVEFAKRCAAEAASRDLIVYLENEPWVAFVVRDLETSLRFIKEVDAPNFLFNVDTGHLNVMKAAPRELEPLMPHIVHVHISDNGGLVDSHDDLGSGTSRNAEYVRYMLSGGIDRTAERHGLDGAVATIEINPNFVPPVVRLDPDRAVQRALDYVRANIPELTP